MRQFIVVKLLLLALIHIQDIRFSFPSDKRGIFPDYQNQNFSQKLAFKQNQISAEIKSSDPQFMNLNYRIYPNESFINTLEPPLRELVTQLSGDRILLKDFLQSISAYLKNQIRYTEKEMPQDPLSVIINRKANCIGFSNLVSLILEAESIKTAFVKGFYLQKKGDNVFSPIPHRWLEIHLPDKSKYFYDPQYQNFSANYLRVKNDVVFKSIRKFEVYLIKKTKKIIN